MRVLADQAVEYANRSQAAGVLGQPAEEGVEAVGNEDALAAHETHQAAVGDRRDQPLGTSGNHRGLPVRHPGAADLILVRDPGLAAPIDRRGPGLGTPGDLGVIALEFPIATG